MPASQSFEDRLLTQLQRVVADNAPHAAASPRRGRARLALAGATLAAAVAAVALVLTGSDATPSAYAVQPKGDGAVSVSIHSLGDAAGLQRALRAAGVPAEVRYGTGCGAPAPGAGSDVEPGGTRGSDHGPSLSGPGPAPGDRASRVSGSVRKGPDGVTFTIDTGDLAAGERVFITTSSGTVDTVSVGIGRQAPAAPPC